jgi:hypothetical protein
MNDYSLIYSSQVQVELNTVQQYPTFIQHFCFRKALVPGRGPIATVKENPLFPKQEFTN